MGRASEHRWGGRENGKAGEGLKQSCESRHSGGARAGGQG